MAGGTHVFDMIKRLKENENLKKKNYFKKTKGTYKRTSKSINVDYKTATKEEREEIREDIGETKMGDKEIVNDFDFLGSCDSDPNTFAIKVRSALKAHVCCEVL